MNTNLLPCVEIEPAGQADSAVIWLHGLGADGNDFAGIVPALNLPENAAVRFIFPHAPERPVTVNNGWVMRAWYDILEMNVSRKVDTASLLESAEQISALIRRETDRGVPAERIVLAGFSQGGAVAYQAGLAYPQPLAGILALSTYVPCEQSLRTAVQPDNKTLPIMIAHGSQDDVVPIQLGEVAKELLTELGFTPEWRTYPIDHSVSLDEVTMISDWLKNVLNITA
ncbi:alpha/beta hydrolase [Aliamphritea ceti]|uniref:alpha/beta hydrolase n=1 Tax=Aliamphritea ceti TaxID=1524258 RepID=UPI0021C49875|nr:alpha/beta hydrolase [Aliamphritea ceti]